MLLNLFPSSTGFSLCAPKSFCESAQTELVLLNPEDLFDLLFQLGLLERAALNLVEADSVDQILRAQNPKELAHVELGHEHFFVAREDFAEIRGQRIKMAQVN